MLPDLSRYLTDFCARRELPRWLSVAAGLVCVVVGAVLTLRPFTSLAVLIVLVAVAAVVTGVSELLTAGASPAPRWAGAAGVLWIAVGAGVAAWPGLSIGALTLWVGIGLIAGGAVHVVNGLRRREDQWIGAALGGLASVILGVLALVWPDVTVLVIAVVFGVRTVWFGLTLLIAALRRPPVPDGDGERDGERDGDKDAIGDAAGDAAARSGVRRWSRSLGAVAALVAAALLATLSVTLHRASPTPDAFYSAPGTVPPEPGALLRSEPFGRAVPEGARAWRVLYTTTRDEGVPALASALVVAAADPPAGPRPVIAWAHGTTGVAAGCAPSLLKDPFAAGALPALDEVIAKGWVLVATDYSGLGTRGPHPYLIGQGEARSVLDAVRAAKKLPQLSLAGQTVVWGHSQGGHAALWAGTIAPEYAPDTHVTGVAALAPASDLAGLVGNLGTVPGGSIFASYAIAAYAAGYPDVRLDDYIRPAARTITRRTADRCLAEPEVFVSIASSLLADKPVFDADPNGGALGRRLRENTPTGAVQAPVLLGQGEADPLITPAVQAAYVSGRCALGGRLDYRTYPGRDHVGVVAAGSPLIPDLLAWTQDRFDGAPAPSSC